MRERCFTFGRRCENILTMLEFRFQNRERDPAPLTSPGLTIGADRISGIVIDEKGVKGFHADLRVDGETILIEDVGTGLGTYVNGRRIGGAVPIRVGDEIRIGPVVLIVAEPGSESEEAQTSTLGAEGAEEDASQGKALLEPDWALRAESGPLEGKVFPITGSTKVGRALDCEISIPEARLSREHAEIDIEIDHLVVRDLDSSNGTYHNGNRVQHAELRHGDMLALDTLSFRVIGPSIETDETVIDIRPERIGEDPIEAPLVPEHDGSRSVSARGGSHFPLWGLIALGGLAIAGGVYYYLNFS